MKGKKTFVMFLFGLPPVKYMKVENLSPATDANSSKKIGPILNATNSLGIHNAIFHLVVTG